LENTETYTTEPTKEDIENLGKDFQYVHDAQDRLLEKLFGLVPQHPGDYVVDRKPTLKQCLKWRRNFNLGKVIQC